MNDHQDTTENSARGETYQDNGSGHRYGSSEQDEAVDDVAESRIEQKQPENKVQTSERGTEAALHKQYAYTRHKSEQNDHGGDSGGNEQMFQRRFFISILLSIPILLYSEPLQRWLEFTVLTIPGSEWINLVFAVVVFVYGGGTFFQVAVPEIKNRSPGMMTLISIVIGITFVYGLVSAFFSTETSFLWESVTLINIMLLVQWIKIRSERRASSAVDDLVKLMPRTAELITNDGDTEEVPVSEISEDDLVLVRPGASMPADGIIVENESDVNESMITGISKPVPKEPGDEVIAGTINGENSLCVRVSATGDETRLANIIRLVEEAQQIPC